MSDAPRILGIDDSLTIRKLLELSFAGGELALELASTGATGLDQALRAPPRLILLDYVLPDMKGIDVCNALARDERTRGVPVIVMSAKCDDVRAQFKGLVSVVGFIAKPFTPPAITSLVRSVLGVGTRAHAAGAPTSGFTFAEQEVAARALFARLRERFARIPSWLPELGGEAPDVFFARRILTPDCLDGLLGALAPLLARGHAATPPPAGQLHGSTALLPLERLLGELADQQRTGVLTLTRGDAQTLVYMQRGEIVLATASGRDDSALRAAVGASRQLLSAAQAEQERSGRPALIALAEAGRISAEELPAMLRAAGRRALLDAVDAGPCAFAWNDHTELPDFVRSHCQPLPVEQLRLERMRGVDDWSQVELAVGSHDLVFRRAANFVKRLERFTLEDIERRVLTLVNQRNSVKQIIDRSRAPTFEVFHVLFRLAQVGLIEPAAGDASGSRPTVERGRPVVILERDAEGVVAPLAGLLKARGTPLIAVESAVRLGESMLSERPQMVIANPSAGGDLAGLAKQARAHVETSDLVLVALLDAPDQAVPAGFDAALAKPVAWQDLERLLDAPPAHAPIPLAVATA
ncbi:MAG: response regulator [Planctomycetes bacterium]|nr:response regulator [Planctomycetota bacterium]